MKSVLLSLCLIACSYCIKMTEVWGNRKISLPKAASENKYFYLTNINYYLYSRYIYICLEDNGYNLDYYNIKYCRTSTNTHYYPEDAIKYCAFCRISYYTYHRTSGATKYYYKIPKN